MAATFQVSVSFSGGPRRRGRASFAAEALTVEAGGERAELRYAELTRIFFDGRRLHLADERRAVALTLRGFLGLPRPGRTKALARALHPVAGRPAAHLPEDALRQLR